MAKLEIELSEFDALRDAKNKAENDLKEFKQSHKEEIADLKNTIKEIEKRARVIIKHENKYFYSTKIDDATCEKLFDVLTNNESATYFELLNALRYHNSYSNFHTINNIVGIIINKLRDNDVFVKAPQDMIPAFSEHGEPDQYIGFDDIELKVENELKEQYINNQNEIKKQLEQQIQKYEDKYKKVDSEFQNKYDERIKVLEGKFNSSREEINKLNETHKEEVDILNETHKEEVDKLNETHKEEVDKLKDELKEAQKTKEEKILEAEEKLKEAQEVLKKLTNNPRKKWYQFWK